MKPYINNLNENINFIYLQEQVKKINFDKNMAKEIASAAKSKNPVKMAKVLKNIPEMNDIEIKNYGEKVGGSVFKQNYIEAKNKFRKDNPVSSLSASLYASIRSLENIAKQKINKKGKKLPKPYIVDLASRHDSLVDALKDVGDEFLRLAPQIALSGLRMALMAQLFAVVGMIFGAPLIVANLIVMMYRYGQIKFFLGMILIIVKSVLQTKFNYKVK